MENKNNLLAFMNKRKAEAKDLEPTTTNKKSKAKTIPVRPTQGTRVFGKLFGIQTPNRADERATESDECPGDERPC
eukprot:5794246-Heterocapsa_arctica.AAC.1